jgi:23S rRNA (adenine2030-N6)-methyltransferase
VLSYQHAYHAGNAADVHKHALLVALLGALRRKPKPFVVVDTHAGTGVYDLGSVEARTTGEWQGGIGRLWPLGPPALAPYLEAVRAQNPGGALVAYPGSPAIVREALRADDRAILTELHPAAFAALRRWAGADPRLAVHRREAGESLRALLPPAIRRGLVLIDPPYEVHTDYGDTAAHATAGFAKWPEGIFMVWYPLLADDRRRPLVEGLSRIDAPMLRSELDFDAGGLADAPGLGLRGSGAVVVNPPWQFDRDAAAIGEALARTIGVGPAARHTLAWIRPPR